MSPEVARALEGTESLLSRAADLRRQIESTAVTDIRVVRDKAELLAQAEALSGKLRLAADSVVGAALAAEGISDEEASEISGEENVGGARGPRGSGTPRRTRRAGLIGTGWRLWRGWSLRRWGTTRLRLRMRLRGHGRWSTGG